MTDGRLPGTTTGPGPLRRRAELTELRRELIALEAQRQEASRAADAMRESVVASERHVLEATDAASVAHAPPSWATGSVRSTPTPRR